MPYDRPYGDDWLIKTPALDRMEERLYQERKQREQYLLQQNKSLDDEFARNMSGIRDADIPDLTKAYGEFKLAHQGLMRNRNATPEQQLEVLRKKSAIYDIIGKSKEYKSWLEDQGKLISRDTKGLYAEDAHQQLIDRLKIPTLKTDRDKDEDLLWKFGNTDFTKEEKTAAGTLREIGGKVIGPDPDDPLKDLQAKYKVGNSPVQYFNALGSSITGSKKDKDYQRLVNNHYTDQEVNDITTRFNAKINDPKFKELYGDDAANFPSYAYNDPLGKAMRIKAMEYTNNLPLNETVAHVLNADRKRLADEAFKLKMEGIRDKHIRERAKSKDESSGTTGNGFDDIKDATYKNFYSKGGVFYNNDGSPKTGEVFITGSELPATVKSALKAGGIDPNYTIAGVNATVKDGKIQSISNKLIGTVNRESMEGVYQPKMDTERKGEHLSFQEEGEVEKNTQAASSAPTYKKSDLLKGGWTEDQIKKAVKAGKIKVN